MATNSPLLRQLLQVTNDNPNSWGDVLNDSGLQILEDAIAGAQTIDVTSADYSLVAADTNGGPSGTNHPRYMFMNVIGSPGTPRTITVPNATVPPESRARTKLYLVNNQSDNTVTVVTAAGGSTGPTIPATQARFVYIDGTNGIAIESDVSLATDSSALGGVAAASYARLDVGPSAQTYSAGQAVTRVALPLVSGSDYRPNLALSNGFYHEVTTGQVVNLRTPSNPIDGGQFSIVLEQGTGGGTITFADSAFAFAGGAAPALSSGLGKFDYLGFEYSSDLAAWIGSIIKDVTIV